MTTRASTSTVKDGIVIVVLVVVVHIVVVKEIRDDLFADWMST
jgi:hypothetical protein